MKVIFERELGKLYDLLQMFGIWFFEDYHEKDIGQYYTDIGVEPGSEVAEAWRYILHGLDKNTPGLRTLNARKDPKNGDRLFSSFFIYRLRQVRTIDRLIEEFDGMIHGDFRFHMLAFFDEEEHPAEYYREIANDRPRLHEFAAGLKISDTVRLELCGIVSGSAVYADALLALLRTVRDRLEEVYRNNEALIRESEERLQARIDASERFFFLDMDQVFASSSNKYRYDEVHVIMSFVNSIHVRWVIRDGVAELFLGKDFEGNYSGNMVGDLRICSSFFKAMSDESRIRILELLRKREMYIGEISKDLVIPLTTLAYHINTLREAKIIKCRNVGKKTVCEFDPLKFEGAAVVLNIFSGSTAAKKELDKQP